MFRIFEEVSVDTRRRLKKKDDNRLVGSSVFPVDLEREKTSQHHPWACSLRTRGFRGRHRCGVTLLSGKRSHADLLTRGCNEMQTHNEFPRCLLDVSVT